MNYKKNDYFIGLDHIRALAAFLVYTWHFLYLFRNNIPVPSIPFNILNQGHTGVSLFMVLSGYIFAKIIGNKKIIYKNFIWNRVIRLLPLLVFVIIINFLIALFNSDYDKVFQLTKSILYAPVRGSLPNAGWSVVVEFHFYIIMPLIIYLIRKNIKYSILLLFISLAFKTILYYIYGDIFIYSYFTLIGRFDQLLLGMIFATLNSKISKIKFFLILVLYFFLYNKFELLGGLYFIGNSNVIWIFLPALEGIFYGYFISYYDRNYNFNEHGISKFIGKIGKYSYSIYLMHLFFVFYIANFLGTFFKIDNIFTGVILSLITFLLIILPVSFLTYRYIESYFFKFKKNYILE